MKLERISLIKDTKDEECNFATGHGILVHLSLPQTLRKRVEKPRSNFGRIGEKRTSPSHASDVSNPMNDECSDQSML